MEQLHINSQDYFYNPVNHIVFWTDYFFSTLNTFGIQRSVAIMDKSENLLRLKRFSQFLCFVFLHKCQQNQRTVDKFCFSLTIINK